MNKYKIHFPREVESGIALINKGEYFQAHEILEFAWRNDKKYQRQLYQGLVQVSVLLYHLERENKTGAIKLLSKALENIAPFVMFSTSLDITRLVSDLKELSARLERIDTESVSHLANEFRIHTPDSLSG